MSKKDYLFHSENFDIPEDAMAKNPKGYFIEQSGRGSKMVLKNIFFDFNKATLRDESKAELDRVYKVRLKNPPPLN
ncbi:MAG: hypothetical protein R2764_08090 [Bacteroidales bacterium]